MVTDMTSGTDHITAAIIGEQGLSFKGGKLFGRRTIPGSASLQTKELSWMVKDHDGSHLRPKDHLQARRMMQRGRAIRDLQALLTSSSLSGVQAADILKAFHLMYWMLPIIERHSHFDTETLKVCDQICNKAGGQSLEGFSGCRAIVVWGDLPPEIRNLVGHWLNGQYRRVKSGRTNEYQLNIQDAVDSTYMQQQQAAFACCQQLQAQVASLNACLQQVHHRTSLLSQGSAQHTQPVSAQQPSAHLDSSNLHDRATAASASPANMGPGSATLAHAAAPSPASQHVTAASVAGKQPIAQSAAGVAPVPRRPATALAALHVRASSEALIDASAQRRDQQTGADAFCISARKLAQHPRQHAEDKQVNLNANSSASSLLHSEAAHTADRDQQAAPDNAEVLPALPNIHCSGARAPSSPVTLRSMFLQQTWSQQGTVSPPRQASNRTSTTAMATSSLGKPKDQATEPASDNAHHQRQQAAPNGQQSSKVCTSAAGHDKVLDPSSAVHLPATSSEHDKRATLHNSLPERYMGCSPAQGASGSQTSAGRGSAVPAQKQPRRSVSTDDDQPVGKRSRLNPGIVPDSDGEDAEPATAASDQLDEQRTQPAQHAEANIVELGRIYHGPGSQNFWSPSASKHHHVLPLGYRAQRTVWNKSKRCTEWTLTVKLVGNKPCFEVSNELGFKYEAPYMAAPSSEVARQGLLDAKSFGFEDDVTQHALKQLLDKDQQEQAQLQTAASAPLALSLGHQPSQACSQQSSQPSSPSVPTNDQLGCPNSQHLGQQHRSSEGGLSQPSATPVATDADTDGDEHQSDIRLSVMTDSDYRAEGCTTADDSPQREKVHLQRDCNAQAAAVPGDSGRGDSPAAPEIEGAALSLAEKNNDRVTSISPNTTTIRILDTFQACRSARPVPSTTLLKKQLRMFGHTGEGKGQTQSSTLQRIKDADVASASVDSVQELILSLLPVLPRAASLDGFLNGWMAEMDINNDPSRQTRVKGLFRDLQFVLTRLPFPQAEEAVHVMLQSVTTGYRKDHCSITE